MRAKISILFVCLPAFAGAVPAQTPDGQTPAEETVCSVVYSGAAFGLCNAYCEAMDCDCDGINCTANANDTACGAVAERFTQISGDPIGPACGMACPCFFASEWPFNDGTWTSIVKGTGGGLTADCTGYSGVRLRNATQWAGLDTTNNLCEYGDWSENGGFGLAQNQLTGLTADQVTACLNLLPSCVCIPPCGGI